VSTILSFLTPAISQFVLFTGALIFYLIYRQNLRNAVVFVVENRETRLTILKVLNDIDDHMTTYFGTFTLVNICLGLVAAVLTWATGLPNPLLWGVLACVFNYIPYIGPALVIQLPFTGGLEHCSLEAGETELETGSIEHRTRQLDQPRPAGGSKLGQLGPTGIRQTEELRRFVERLTRRVVPGFAQADVSTNPLHFYELRMSARHQQRDVRERRRLRLEQRREQVAFEVMHADGRPVPGVSEAACEGGTRQKCADQAGASGVGDAIQLGWPGIGLGQRGTHQWQQPTHVIPRGQLRNDPAEDPMQVYLAEKLVGQQAALAI